MPAINASVELIQPVSYVVGSLTSFLYVLLGGVVGIYVIMLLLRWSEIVMMKKFMKEIKKEISSINERLQQMEKNYEKRR